MTDFDFSSMNIPKVFQSRRHNNTDHKAFKDFQSDFERVMGDREKDSFKEARAENLKLWDAQTPNRWKNASLKNLDSNSRKKILNSFKNRESSFYIDGRDGSGKTYTAYAIARRLIGQGRMIPSSFRLYTESELLSLSDASFASKDKIKAIVDEKHVQMIVLDDVGKVNEYNDRELTVIERMIEKAYSESSYFIITSTLKPSEWVKKLSSSSANKLKELIGKNILTVNSKENDDSVWSVDDSRRSFEDVGNLY